MISSVNLALFQRVAHRLGPLKDRVVFLGGATTGLLVTDPACASVRSTKDIDLIVEVFTRVDYDVTLRNELLNAGFVEDIEEGAPLCRWVVDDVKVDVMPTGAEILGFTNQWYATAIKNFFLYILPDRTSIQVVTAPYFLGTKLEAFRGRGKGDYIASHDLEDIITVVDGRPSLLDELKNAPDDLRGYLKYELRQLLADDVFLDALPGHLPGDSASQARVTIVEDRLRRLADLR